MDFSRTELQRLLEGMDKVIEKKQKELTELEERLEGARIKLSEKEAQEIRQEEEDMNINQVTGAVAKSQIRNEDLNSCLSEQKKLYEQQIALFNDELTELEGLNRNLTKENVELNKEMKVLQDELNNMKTESQILVEKLEETQSANLELNLRLARAENESQMQQKLLKKSHAEDEILMNAFNDKLESLKKAIDSRDEEIRKLRSDNRFTLESLGIKQVSGELGTDNEDCYMSEDNPIDIDKKHRVINIANSIREKDAQINVLKGQLMEATRELEKNAAMLESLLSERKRATNEDDNQNEQISINEHFEETVKRSKALEEELEAKDKQLTEIEYRNHFLEKLIPEMISDILSSIGTKQFANPQEYNHTLEILSSQLGKLLQEVNCSKDLLDKCEQLKSLVQAKDRQIERLVSDLNHLDSQFNLALRGRESETEQFYEPSSQPSISADLMVVGSSNDQSQDIERLRVDKTETSEHQFIKSDTKSQLITDQTHGNSQSSLPIQSESEDFQSTQISNLLPASTPIIEESSKSQKDEHSIGSDESKNGLKSQLSKGVPVARTSNESGKTINIDTVLNLQRRLRQLENENELLELAMKEILLSIKWSDSQCSTILIDCPSLERLCQLIEARFLAQSTPTHLPKGSRQDNGPCLSITCSNTNAVSLTNNDLFQFVLLKSELDLLRGQNEQLRADVKIHRREYQELLNSSEGMTALPPTKLLSIRSNANLSTEVDTESSPKHQQVDVRAESGIFSTNVSMHCEAECQTDLTLETLIAPTDRVLQPLNNQEQSINDSTNSCKYCTRSSKLINHLYQSISRIESRLTMSDESYVARLIILNRLVHLLGRDLAEYCTLLNESRRECHLLRQQKMLIESKLDTIKSQTIAHFDVCPMPDLSSYVPDQMKAMKTFTSEVERGDSMNTRLTIGKTEPTISGVPIRNTKVTISLLRSIISCLQARLDYKDERLQYLENLLSTRDNVETPL